MDGELLSSPSDIDTRGSKPASSYTEMFYEAFPYYLAIGMTAEQFWDGDCTLPKYYRKAEELRQESLNRQAWLQGMYVYDAIARLSPILHAFAKKGTKAKPYTEEPYPINKKEVENLEERKEKARMEKAKRFMEAFRIQQNKRFETKGAADGERND